jgi:ectoine hydroxylase
MERLHLVPNLIEQVHTRIVDAIAAGVLAPGERLTQEEIAERLSVSRQPVSHALQLLKQQGLVIEHGRRGLSVAPVDPDRMRDLFQLRAAIDGLASRLAAERLERGQAATRDIESLKQHLAAGNALSPEAPVHDWIDADISFHQSVYRLSGNLVIAETVAQLWPHFKRCIGVSLSDLKVRTAIWGEHAAIANGILSGASRAAESAATHHAEKAGIELYRRLKEHEGRAKQLAEPDRKTQGETIMLDEEQIAAFDRDGYILLPDCFDQEEVALLRSEAEEIYKSNRQEVWREKSGAPRTAFAAHTYNEAFRRLGAHPRLIEPVEQLFGEGLYMHQFKINAKAPSDGELWPWHQDYGVWSREDGMPEPRAMNIAVFLDEVMPFNGPLMFIPCSHKSGVLAAGHDTTTTSYPIWSLDNETVALLTAQGGIVAPTGKPGTVLLFHGNLVHASPPNMTPYPRKIVYLTLCAVSNTSPSSPVRSGSRIVTSPDRAAERQRAPCACAGGP